MLKIMKILLKIEKWFLDKCIEKDTLEYEDYLYSIKKHEKEIERIMDGLLDFGDDEKFLALYKKLCRHVYTFYPQMVGKHIAIFRMQFEEKEEKKNGND